VRCPGAGRYQRPSVWVEVMGDTDGSPEGLFRFSVDRPVNRCGFGKSSNQPVDTAGHARDAEVFPPATNGSTVSHGRLLSPLRPAESAAL
jgi:hypothetical protein